MKIVGGFFELELNSSGKAFHQKACALWCGRACLSLIVQKLEPIKIYVPFYVCDTLLEPLIENHIEYVFYEIDENLEIKNLPFLAENELLIYVNYFGLKENYVEFLAKYYEQKLIVDNTQAFFSFEANAIWFNSARKFFGVADGAYLSASFEFPAYDALPNADSSFEHLIDRLIENQDAAYQEFLVNEARFDSSLKKISVLSERILASVDYEAVRRKRRENFGAYEESFGKMNRLKLTLGDNETPFCYPLWLDGKIEKTLLHQQNIFVPTLWQDVLKRNKSGFEFEKTFAADLLALPCDQRYDRTDCLRVVSAVQQIIYER